MNWTSETCEWCGSQTTQLYLNLITSCEQFRFKSPTQRLKRRRRCNADRQTVPDTSSGRCDSNDRKARRGYIEIARRRRKLKVFEVSHIHHDEGGWTGTMAPSCWGSGRQALPVYMRYAVKRWANAALWEVASLRMRPVVSLVILALISQINV